MQGQSGPILPVVGEAENWERPGNGRFRFGRGRDQHSLRESEAPLAPVVKAPRRCET